MSSLASTAITLGAALLPPLIEEIKAALDEGLDEKQATERALERMRAAGLPEPVSDEIARRFAAARAELEAQGAPLVHASDLAVIERVAVSKAWSREERDALERGLAALRPLARP